jgi:DNA repair protein RadC
MVIRPRNDEEEPGEPTWEPADDLPDSYLARFAEAPARGLFPRPNQRERAMRRFTPGAAELNRPFQSEGPHGHRDRMRDRLLDRGADSLADYELLEMLLFFAQPKGDTKPLAKRLINQFGSYANVIAAAPSDLEKISGVGRFSIAALKLVHGAAIRLARAELQSQPVFGTWEPLMDYLNAAMAREKVEHFRVLYLDTKNRLIADELQGRGTINHTPVYPREVAKRALELSAAALIIAHNHPSGDPTPSTDDVKMTMELDKLLRSLSVALHDHVIVGNGRWTSFRKEGFL